MITTNSAVQQSDILGRVLSQGAIPREAATYLAALELSPADRTRLDELAERARRGTFSEIEERELEEFRRVGRLVEVLKLNARRALAA